MRKVKILTGMIFLILPSAASAEWLKIGTSDSGADWYMDGARTSKVGGRTQAWVKIDASRDATVKYREKKVLYSFICASHKIRQLSMVTYDSYGKVLDSNSNTDSSYSEYGYEPVVPETMGESVLNIACAITDK